MKLVDFDNYEISVQPEIILLKPFKRVFNQDRTPKKSHFYEFLTIVYFVYDPRSDFSYIVDEEERLKEVCKANGFELPKFTKEQKEAIELYKKMTQTASGLLLEDVKITIDNLRKMLKSIKYDALDEKDKINAIKNIATVTGMLPKLAKDLSDAEKAVNQEIKEQGRARGNEGQKTIMDDAILV